MLLAIVALLGFPVALHGALAETTAVLVFLAAVEVGD